MGRGCRSHYHPSRGGNDIKQTLRACRRCREELAAAGYQIVDLETTEALDECPFCGLRTGVKIVEIRKGEGKK